MSHRLGALSTAAGLALVVALGATPVSAESLADAISLAYQTNPTLQAQRAQQRALDESYVQARVGLRPSVDASASSQYSRTWTDSTAGGLEDTDGDGIPDTVVPASDGVSSSGTGSVSVGVDQVLYTGGRTSYGIAAARADILRGRENLRAVEAEVLQNVIQAYVDVRRDMEALRIRQENVGVLQRQLEEASARFEVGEITRTDVAQAEARLSASEAQLAQAQAQLSASRANYAAVVGQAPTDLEPEPPLPGLPGDFDVALDTALVENPSMLAAAYAEDAARMRVSQARAAYRPTASLRASYGTSGSGQDGFDGFDLTDRQSLTVGASVSVPLFSGGLNASRIAQALEQANIAQIGVEGARRDVLRTVSQAFSQVIASRAALASNQEAVEAARIAAEGVRQEAQVGLRTTLDVLNAEQELRAAELTLIQARRDEYVASALLLAAMGRLEAPRIVPGVDPYDPEANFERVRDRGAVPWEPIVEAIDRIGAPAEHVSNDQVDAPIDTQLKAQAAEPSEAIATAP